MTLAGRPWSLTALALWSASLGCAELDERERFEPVVAVLEIAETIPPDGAREVDPLTRIDLCMSAEVDPRALESFSATLRSASLTFDTDVEVQLFSWRGPGSRAGFATERWCPGSVLSLTPVSAMQPGLTYRIQLRPALLGWAGEALDTEQPGWAVDDEGELRWYMEFHVAGSPGDEPPQKLPEPEPGPRLSELFEAGEVFDPQRGACDCHQGSDELATARLDLTTPEIAWEALVLDATLEATDFPMVTPREPSQSYLIQKLIRTASGERLHALQGEPMPPNAPVPHADLVRVARWIASGANL